LEFEYEEIEGKLRFKSKEDFDLNSISFVEVKINGVILDKDFQCSFNVGNFLNNLKSNQLKLDMKNKDESIKVESDENKQDLVLKFYPTKLTTGATIFAVKEEPIEEKVISKVDINLEDSPLEIDDEENIEKTNQRRKQQETSTPFSSKEKSNEENVISKVDVNLEDSPLEIDDEESIEEIERKKK